MAAKKPNGGSPDALVSLTMGFDVLREVFEPKGFNALLEEMVQLEPHLHDVMCLEINASIGRLAPAFGGLSDDQACLLNIQYRNVALLIYRSLKLAYGRLLVGGEAKVA